MVNRSQLPTYQFSKAGFQKLQQEKADLEIRRPQAVEDLSKARDMGDLSENGYYKAARQKLSELDSRMRRVNLLLKYGKVLESKDTNTIQFGNTVTIADGKIKRTFELVGKEEANPMLGKLSVNSPIGKAILGKKVGDTVEVFIPAGKVEYTITSIT